MSAPNPVHFLLVDDLEDNLLTLEALLRREGLVLLKAESGLEALELLLAHDVALALVDVQMPVMDGFELAELIRGMERTRRIPIIFLTAGGPDPERRFRGYEAGAVDFIRKPIEPDVLRSKADVFFELACQREELRAATEENARLLLESQRQSEMLRDADKRKDEFLATLAHELRNPLAPIRNAVEFMRITGLNDPKLEWARDVIDRQLTGMTRLVDELLDVSRIATGKLVLHRESTSLASVFNQAIESSQAIVNAKQHQLEVKLANESLMLDVDSVRLTQVLSNLLTNAAKYTDPGGRIGLCAQIIEREVEIRVEDNGIGIRQEMLTEVFGLFTQVDRTLERSLGGLGVGLALVRRLVELHGGTVSTSRAGLGRGSTFAVRLPIDHHCDMRESVFDDFTALCSNRALRVLIVDDNHDAAQSLAMLLDSVGHETQTAFTGPDGYALALSFRPQVIFLDIGLPELNGYDLARRIRSNRNFENATFIALSGWGTDADKNLAMEAGFDLHLTKPVSAHSLQEILTNLRF